MIRDLYIYEKRGVDICEKRLMQEEGYSHSLAHGKTSSASGCATHMSIKTFCTSKKVKEMKRDSHTWGTHTWDTHTCGKRPIHVCAKRDV